MAADSNQEAHFSFTKTRLLNLSAADKRKEYHDTVCRNLTLQVTPAGTKTFYRYGRINGRPERIRIGRFPETSVEQARDAIAVHNGNIVRGENPAAEKRDRKKQMTIGGLWEWFLKNHAQKNKVTWEKDQKTYQRDIEPFAKNIPIKDFERSEVIELSNGAIDRQGSPSAGTRVIELISSMYVQAINNEWIDRNPAYKVPKPPKNDRDRYLQPDEVKPFFEGLENLQSRPRDFLLLCIYTGQRRANVLSMRPHEEINWSTKTWTIPKEKVKGRKTSIVVPLPEEAIEVISNRIAQNGDSPWLFPSPASKTGHYICPKHSWKKLLAGLGLANIRIHDLRRTLGSWQANQGSSLEVIGQSLGHRRKETTEIYARLHVDTVRKSMNRATKAIKKASDSQVNDAKKTSTKKKSKNS